MLKWIERKRKTNRQILVWIVILLPLVFFVFSGWFVPDPLFNSSYSTVLESRDGQLLGARIAIDEQWRFPAIDSIPAKYEKCVLLFEDRFFYRHPGVNLVSLTRAMRQNIEARKIVSGGSTISMQVCRMARGNKKRSLSNKLIEMLWALHIELRYSKTEILKTYASHAPFGGNIGGINAASWRYFGRDCHELSWAESATLAVLPNAPALIYPGRLDKQLKQKRDRLLQKLLHEGCLDSLTYTLALEEPLPEKVNALPQLAYHLMEKCKLEKNGERVRSFIDGQLQYRVTQVVGKHQKELEANYIHNLAAIVVEIPSKRVLAYVGNSPSENNQFHGHQVDIIQSPRSTGSILKPFLYCKMLDEGLVLPSALVPDIPIRFGGFTPMNFDREYNGAVSAEEALALSLNIPAVHMLKEYGVAPFHSSLKRMGMSSLLNKSDHYGLSLILGGAEVKLWDLAGMYASLGSILKNYNENDGFYASEPFLPLTWCDEGDLQNDQELVQPFLRAASVYSTLEAMLKVKRPESEAGWERFAQSKKIAWKTGTSFGFRDAWAVGVSSKHVVAVWAGNADGEGRVGLTGVTAAAPVLFDIFALLPNAEWFSMPNDEMTKVEVCGKSGYLPGKYCGETREIYIPKGNQVGICPWHQRVHLNAQETHRVSAACYPVSKMKHKSWFVLPPSMEYYYKQQQVLYATLPPLMPGCIENQTQLEFIYPREWNKLFIPVDLDGTPGKLVFELAHRNNNAKVYWYLDENYLGITHGIHQFELRPSAGWHQITVTDEQGNSLSKKFFIANE